MPARAPAGALLWAHKSVQAVRPSPSPRSACRGRLSCNGDASLSVGSTASWSEVDFGIGCLGLSPPLPFLVDLEHMTQ